MSRTPPSKARAASIRDSNIAVVTVNYRTPELTERCIAALAKERERLPRLRAVVVDGGSGDGSAAELGEALARPDYAGWIEFLPLPINGGFGWANNRGIQRLMRSVEPPRYIHALNPDTEVEADAVAYLAQYLDQHPRVAAVGSQLLSMDGSRVGSAFSFPSIRGEFARAAATRALERLFHIPPISIETDEAAEVDWVTGGSVMLRVEALRQVGLFDEGFFLYNEEVELMWRLRKAGWSVAVEPRSRVRHVGGGATGISERSWPLGCPSGLRGLARGTRRVAREAASWRAHRQTNRSPNPRSSCEGISTRPRRPASNCVAARRRNRCSSLDGPALALGSRAVAAVANE